MNVYTLPCLRTLAFVAFLNAPALSLAETVYVNDRLQLGVHQDNTLASTIVALVPSGTAMEVLTRVDDMMRVRLNDGVEGWVDATLITDVEPGRSEVLKLRSELEALRATLTEAEARSAETEAQVAELENQLAASRSAPERDGGEADTIPSETLREMQALAEENQRLKEQLTGLEESQREAIEKAALAEEELQRAKSASTSASVPEMVSGFSISRWERWQQILLASALLLAFAAGGWMVDWGIRRRHGGFRV